MMTHRTKTLLGMMAAVAAVGFTARAAWAGCDEMGGTWAFAADEVSRNGLANCFVSTANLNGENPDLTPEVCFAQGTKVVAMTKDTRRCRGGRNSGNACTYRSDCPDGGECTEPTPGACAPDAKGKVVYFIFDGNPTGQNADLSPELFSFRPKGAQLVQETQQSGACEADPARACVTDADCVAADGSSSSCRRPEMGDLQVGPGGRAVMFRTTGDLGGNASHASALYLLTGHGKKRKVSLLAGGGSPKACSDDTEKARQSCTKDADCGAVCNDGTRDVTEQCESSDDCAAGQVCEECRCLTIRCGDGLVHPGEACEPTMPCGGTCAPDCSACTPHS